MQRFFRFALLVLLTAGLAWPPGAAASGEDSPSPRLDVYRYRMKGKVRLLFFWVGKDDVGGGHIAVGRRPEPAGGWTEQIEVLFGSNPERVPGGINRWGYGTETGQWRKRTGSPAPALARSVFEGFLKHSKEESLDEVQANEAARQDDVFWYDGIRSIVEQSGAVSEIRTFAAAGDFDFRNASPVHCSYQERLRQGAKPDKFKRLDNAKDYQSPFGFLTGVRYLIGRVLERHGGEGNFRRFRPWVPYVYNANLYRLRVKDVDLEKSFDLPLADGSSETYRDVARIRMVIRKEATGEDHEFVLWVPTEGRYEGVPIRIVDKPRWWLRVELNLEPEAEVGRSTLAAVQCE